MTALLRLQVYRPVMQWIQTMNALLVRSENKVTHPPILFAVERIIDIAQVDSKYFFVTIKCDILAE